VVAPQAPDNNQGLWADLENYSRAIAASNEVLVICGPQGFGSAVTASSGEIPIASNVWKIIVAVPLGGGSALSRITNNTRVIAVNIPNIQGIRSDPWENYMTSVNQLQTNTGFNFFTTLNTNLATILRAKVDGSSRTPASLESARRRYSCWARRLIWRAKGTFASWPWKTATLSHCGRILRGFRRAFPAGIETGIDAHQ
jgi:hypothetical protein